MQAVDLTMIKDSVSGVHRSKLIKPGTISLVSSITAGGSSIAAEAAADSDLRTYLQTEMFKAAGAAKVGSQINNHLGQLASATLGVHPEIAASLDKHGFQHGQHAGRFGSQLTAEDMSTLAGKLLPEDHVAFNRPQSSSNNSNRTMTRILPNALTAEYTNDTHR
jgi:hypothetical protein